ncbi:hypothetical protein [Streptomyces rimosus]|uniref:hypothetical protein n=1 Tax=Streptomyces rimosus TaxID=1927 RepID=UPI0004C1711E|nr:hypothetical protein [Streptomyces rimosus]
MSALTPMQRRPAPVHYSEVNGVPHGAPAVSGGELTAMLRDASFYDRPDTRSAKAAHMAVVSSHLTTRVGGQLGALAAACDPSSIMLCDDLPLDAHDVAKTARCHRRACEALFAASERQHSDLEHIRSYYRLEQRIGVRVGLGLRVRHDGHPGVIIDTHGQYLVLRRDGENYTVTVHATSGMEYEGPDGWVPAVPLPDPYAAV